MDDHPPRLRRARRARPRSARSPAANQGQITIDLTSVAPAQPERPTRSRATCPRSSQACPGVTVYVQNPPAISIGGLQSKSLYQYTLQSGNITLAEPGRAVSSRSRLRQLPSLTGVTSDLLIENPQVTIADRPEHAPAALGVTAAEIENTLYDAFGQRQVSTIYTPTNEYWVVMEVLPQYQQDIASLGSLYVRSGTSGAGSGAASPGNVGASVAASTGAPLVPLSAVATFRNDIGPVTVNHSGPVALGHHLLRPGARRVARHCRSRRSRSRPPPILPPDVAAAFTGTAAAYESTQQNLPAPASPSPCS